MILKTWSGSYIDTKEYSGAWIYWAWVKGWVRYAVRRILGQKREGDAQMGDNPEHRVTSEPEGDQFRAVCACGWKSDGLYPRKRDAWAQASVHFAEVRSGGES